MSNDDIAGMRRRVLYTFARATLLGTQDLLHLARKRRASERRKGGTYRLAKEFRAFKSLLLAEERRLLQSARNPRTVRASQRRRALTAKGTRPTTRP